MALQGLHQKVLMELGAAIVAGRPAPGEVLRLEELAAQWDVSRTVIREVIRVLESMNLVDARRRVGVTVRDPAEWSVFDPRLIRWRLDNPEHYEQQCRAINQVRMGIEPVAACLAATQATDAERDDLLATTHVMQRAADELNEDAFHDADARFHQCLLEASHNDMFAALAPIVHEVMLTAGHRFHHLAHHTSREAVRLHVETAEAIRLRDGNRAERCLRSLVAAAQHETQTAAAPLSPA